MINRRLAGILLAIGTTLGLVFTASAAHANSASLQKVYNDTPYLIGVQFHTVNGQNAWGNVAAHDWAGETQANMEFEPRFVHLGAGYCITYFIRFTDNGTDATFPPACGGASGGWVGIYLGDGNNRNYNTHVTSVYAG